ncbi:MAG TPA: HepT-like ribonuclease domain-containing protein [Segeticoccus sp.]|nr:HepT-like ribonuclease domain-containing protein [Segeticoccus sp.]
MREALVHLELVGEYAGGEDLDQLVIDAICMRLSAGVEVLARLDPDVRTRLFGDSWPFMSGMRNRIAHGYLLVDSSIVRKTIEIDVPDIVRTIKGELAAT